MTGSASILLRRSSLLAILLVWFSWRQFRLLFLSSRSNQYTSHPDDSFLASSQENALVSYENPPTFTKIVGFTNRNYAPIAATWYHRMTVELGYKDYSTTNATALPSVVVVAVDDDAMKYLQAQKVHVERLQVKSCYVRDQRRQAYRLWLFGSRWVYVLQQLQQNISVLMTDVDNLFQRHLPMASLEDSEWDVYHAYGGGFPKQVKEKLGFVVCGGMVWLRAVPRVVRFVQMVVDRCQCFQNECGCWCDDQDTVNRILADDLSVQWTTMDHKNVSSYTSQRSGISRLTGHKVTIWDANIAYRGPIDPEVCPVNNWVAMPNSGGTRVNRTLEWDQNCGIHRTTNNQQ